jgi:hypothetical protein
MIDTTANMFPSSHSHLILCRRYCFNFPSGHANVVDLSYIFFSTQGQTVPHPMVSSDDQETSFDENVSLAEYSKDSVSMLHQILLSLLLTL